MLDANILIPPIVKDIIPLERQYPDKVAAFPLCILTPIDSGSGIVISGEERITPLTFQIDVYDTSYQRCEETAHEIVLRLVKRGFTRVPGQIIKEKGLYRHVLSFSAQVDEQHGFVYRR